MTFNVKMGHFEVPSVLKSVSLFCYNLVSQSFLVTQCKCEGGVWGWGSFAVTLLYVMDVLLLLSSRLRGFFVAPQTNNYTFWIQADGQASLYLSLSQDPEHKVLLLAEAKMRLGYEMVLIKVITSGNFTSVNWITGSYYESVAE